LDLSEVAMPQRRQQAEHVPPATHLDAEKIELVIVDGGVGGDRQAAAVVASVADRDLKRLYSNRFTPRADHRMERPGLPQRAHCGHHVSEDAPATLGLGGQAAGNGGAEPDTGDVEEVLVIDAAKVDAASVPGGNHLA